MNFTDQEYKDISTAILNAPVEVAKLEEQKVQALLGKAEAEAKDDTNKLFFDNVQSIILNYHLELKAIDGTVRTEYDPQLLDDGGKLAPGNVHLGGTWPNFVPKIHDSMNGEPVDSVPDYESYRLPLLEDAISLIKDGFTDGALTGTLDQPYSGGTTIYTSVSFPIGSRILVGGGGVSALLRIDNVVVTPPNPPSQPDPITTVTVTVLAPTVGTIPMGANVQNFFAGFSNSERQSGSSAYPELMDYFKSLIVSEKSAVAGFIQTQKDALDANDATGNEKINNQAATAQAESALENFDDWDGYPETGIGGKYTDTGLAILTTTIFNRQNHIVTRLVEIPDALGSVSQAPNGEFSGTGQYFSQAKWINIRINMANGSLRVFYDFDISIKFFDESIALANSKKEEFEGFMLAYLFAAGSAGSVAVIEDPTGLDPGDEVKVMDDDAPVTDMTIISIVGQEVTLSAPISGYSLDKAARLVKPL